MFHIRSIKVHNVIICIVSTKCCIKVCLIINRYTDTSILMCLDAV